MKWISALDLKQWADRVGARIAFPEMIRDLITASASDISEIRFPGGDMGQVRGFDGWLEAAGAPPFVPSGLSVWEFGVSANPAAKFASDYDKRVKEMPAGERQALTFVFATPRSWDNPGEKLPDFVRMYRDKRDFAGVHYYDGVQLEDWLQRCGAVGARHAREVLGRVPQNGARSTDEFWQEYSRRYRPVLTEEVVLCARAAQADQIVTHLLGKAGSLVFMGDGPDEVSAVAVAAIRKSTPEHRAFLEARTLIIDSEDAGRGLGVTDRYGFVVSPGANKVSGLLAAYGPTVSSLGFNAQRQGFDRLERPSTRDMTEALLTMGLSEDEAGLLATKSGRSLSILERHAPAASFEPPAWVTEGDKLLPALLAGGWDSRHEGDKAILAELGGQSYQQIEARLRPFLAGHDSPLDREGGIWKLRAPVDAFVNLSNLLGAEHLTLLGSVATRIFSAPPAEIAEERFGVSEAPFSSRLREGIANMLLMLAALHAEAALDLGQDPVAFVNTVVGSLPGLSDDYRMILSLERQLPALMEAAPDPLLAALERMLEGDAQKIAPIFIETAEYGVPRSQLPNLLWALETLAWDPRYLARVSLVLAQLAEIDPGGRLGNRPIGSLRDIFVAWKPGTNATLSTRLAVLDRLVSQMPRTGWTLLVQLLPTLQDSKSPTQRPRFRDAGASDRETMTRGLLAESFDAIIDRVLAMLGDEAERWAQVVETFPRFSPERRAQFLDMLEVHCRDVGGEDRNALHRATKRIADRHTRFREAQWALSDEELLRLSAIAASLESGDPIEQARALFDEWLPHPAGDFAEAERVLNQRRSQEVAKLARTGGASAVIELAVKARLPQLVAAAAAEGIGDEEMLAELLDRSTGDIARDDFAAALAGALRWRRGEAFDQQLLNMARDHGWSEERVGGLVLGWPEVPSTWQLVETLGTDVETAFWGRRAPRRFEGSAADLTILVNHYLAAGRPGTALEAIYQREGDLEWAVIVSLLGMRVHELNQRGASGDMDGYYIEELFKKLRARDDVPRIELAHWEYVYFALLEPHDHDLVLFDLMASDPAFYVSVLKDVFVEDGTNPDNQEVSDTQRIRGNASHRILMAFDRTPGQAGGTVDGALLDRWVDGMVEAATQARRLNVVYSYIGRALAHSAESDGEWPQQAVAAVIERLKSDELERGLMIERFNMRGIFSKPMFEGGLQERALAQRYRDWSSRLQGTFIRTKAMLEAIARNWDDDGKRADEEAARDKLRFD